VCPGAVDLILERVYFRSRRCAVAVAVARFAVTDDRNRYGCNDVYVVRSVLPATTKNGDYSPRVGLCSEPTA